MTHLDSDKAQALFDGTHGPAAALDWSGLTDVRFIANSVGILLLATLLGAVIGYHPATRRTIDGLHEADMPHVYVMYALIGAVIGVAVREFGTVVGLVVFGIGGLTRFRSAADSTRDTVRLIIVTLVGLTAGLGLLHFAVIITLFTSALIYVFDTRPPYRIRVEGIAKDRADRCTEVYRGILKGHGCSIIAEHHSLEKARIEFVFRLPRRSTRDRLDVELRSIAADLRGDVDWEVT
ncbi:MAG: hypothetical protein AUG46_09970 [Acidobacteria bacterium 13_1_20CM_3_58_11]|nr:MAG: hypothetical protein AUG46_09970 [Acidobacteria bacterium 13_1_20CM_3_58_11]